MAARWFGFLQALDTLVADPFGKREMPRDFLAMQDLEIEQICVHDERRENMRAVSFTVLVNAYGLNLKSTCSCRCSLEAYFIRGMHIVPTAYDGVAQCWPDEIPTGFQVSLVLLACFQVFLNFRTHTALCFYCRYLGDDELFPWTGSKDVKPLVGVSFLFLHSLYNSCVRKIPPQID